MKRRVRILPFLAAVAITLCLLGGSLRPAAFLAAWLAAWFFWIGIAVGGLANVWLHNLTGGEWGEALRIPLLRLARHTWLLALLFIPVLLGLEQLYPWAPHAADGVRRFSDELAAPAFKSAWLQPGFFIGRSIACLVLWSVLAALSQRPALSRSRPFSALALLLTCFSIGIASVDWIMSLTPLWYSSVFGWLVGTGQMLAGMAFAVVIVALNSENKERRPAPALFRDFGNLLMMYVLTWSYLAFTQFLIIWSENLPHEIAWYEPRLRGGWLAMAVALTLLMFLAPLLVLLSRQAKQSAQWMGWLAACLLLMQLVDTWWMVLPSLAVPSGEWAWSAPLAAVTIGLIVLLCWQRKPAGAVLLQPEQSEARHA